MNDKTKEALGILQEECAEVIQAISKVLRFGIDNWHKNGGTQRENLEQEIGDVLAMVDILVQQGVISQEQLEVAKSKKNDKLRRWSGVLDK